MNTEKKVIKLIGILVTVALVMGAGIFSYSPVESSAAADTIVNSDSSEPDSTPSVNESKRAKDIDSAKKQIKKYNKYLTKTQYKQCSVLLAALSDEGISISDYDKDLKKLKSAIAIAKKKYSTDKKHNFKKKYSKTKSMMTASQKKQYNKYYKAFLSAKTSDKVKAYAKKMNSLAAKAKEHAWVGYVQASCYGPYEGETTTATGRAITNGTYYIAVPASRVVSYSSWKKMSASGKKKYFYYHEKITLNRNGKTVTASVEDCGGFAGCGTYYKGKWRERLFDLTPAVFHSLGISGVGIVKWHY